MKFYQQRNSELGRDLSTNYYHGKLIRSNTNGGSSSSNRSNTASVGGQALNFSHTAPQQHKAKSGQCDQVPRMCNRHGLNPQRVQVETKGQYNHQRKVITQTSPMVFVFMKEGSPFIQILYSVGKFGGDPFNPAKYQDQIIGFMGVESRE